MDCNWQSIVDSLSDTFFAQEIDEIGDIIDEQDWFIYSSSLFHFYFTLFFLLKRVDLVKFNLFINC